MVFRVDIGSPLRHARYLADGGACVDAILTRAGVFVYQDEAGKIIREYRPPSEVFDPVSMQSFAALPITDDHPPVMVDAANRDMFKRGRAGDTIGRDGLNMTGALIVDDVGLVAKMRAGKNQVSNGYTCDLEMTAGTSPEGEDYDAIQRNIRGNHIAIVDAGRAGNARARMDGAAFEISNPTTSSDARSTQGQPVKRADSNPEITRMEELQKQLGIALAAVATEKARADALDAKLKAAETARSDAETKLATAETARAKAEGESAQAKTDAAKAKTDAATSQPASVKARVSLETKAARVLGADAKVPCVKSDGTKFDAAISDADDRFIKSAVVRKVDGFEFANDAHPSYVDGRFESACDRAQTGADSLGAVRGSTQTTVDGEGKPIVAGAEKTDAEAVARDKMIKDNRTAYLRVRPARVERTVEEN